MLITGHCDQHEYWLYKLSTLGIYILITNYSNWTEWRRIQGEIGQVISNCSSPYHKDKLKL